MIKKNEKKLKNINTDNNDNIDINVNTDINTDINTDNNNIDNNIDINADTDIDTDIDIDKQDISNIVGVNDDDNITDDSDETVYFKFNTTKHKLEGKHKLKRDTIFYGKLNEDETDDYLQQSNSDYFNKDFPIERGSQYEMESRHFEDAENQRNLKKRIYKLLKNNTDLDFNANRRKPNKQAFNSYYEMIIKELGNQYTKSEMFVELSYYFTDHIFNMYKLLYPIHATNIIIELKDKGYLNELDNMKFI